MKKFWALFALSLAMGMLFPCHASAKEYCEVISGDGKTLGSEIACGEEHFYVIDSDGDQVRVLAKYSLNVGETIYREELPEPIMDRSQKDYTCKTIANQHNGKYNPAFFGTAFYNNLAGNEKYCFYSKGGASYYFNQGGMTNPVSITLPSYSNLKQDATYVSAHWDDNGNYAYPQVGDNYYSFSQGVVRPDVYVTDLVEGRAEGSSTTSPIGDESKYGGHTFADYSFSNRGEIATPIRLYKEKLIEAGFEVTDSTLLTLDDLHSIAEKRGHAFDYQEITDSKVTDGGIDRYFSLKSHLNEEDSWLYDRTYWLRSGVTYERADGSHSPYPNVMLFVDSRGEVCSSPSSSHYDSYACGTTVQTGIGAGVRPLLTMPYDFIFRIRSETDGNGEIEVVERSRGGESIAFKTTARAGFRLKSLNVSIDGGDEFEYDESEIEKDDEGYVTIKNGLFSMPYANVLIKATWAKNEPEPAPEPDVEPEPAPEPEPEPEPEPAPEPEPEPSEDADTPEEEASGEETVPVENPATDDDIFDYIAAIPALVILTVAAVARVKKINK